LIVFPSRTIESDVVIIGPRLIDHDVRFEDSDHHRLAGSQLHEVLYHTVPVRTGATW